MSGLGQNRKSSMRANVFRCSPNNGHRQDTSACPFRAIKRLVQRNKFRKFRPAMRSPRRGCRSHCAASRIDRLGQKRFRAILKRLTLGFRIAVNPRLWLPRKPRVAHDSIRFATASPQALDLPLDHLQLEVGDRLGRVQILRAGLGAVHDGVAAVQPERILEIV